MHVPFCCQRFASTGPTRQPVSCYFLSLEEFPLLPVEKHSQATSFAMDQVSAFRSVDLVGDHCLY